MIFTKLQRIIFTLVLVFVFGSSNAKSPVLTNKELSTPPPRIIRTCCGFGAEIKIKGVPFYKKTDITSLEEMGSHTFMGGGTEKNGIVYTQRGGFLDLGHLRDCADWTAYLYDLIKASQNDPRFVIMELRNEGGEKSLALDVPDDFNEDQIIELAGRIAYDLSLWHEISTWFGARYVPLVPEKFSSFSPEDMYSNLMGVHMGMRAIKSELPYDEAMTLELSKMLDTLHVVKTGEETFDAMLSVNNLWYTNQKKYPSNKITLKRYLELENNLVPWLVPNENCILPPYEQRIPDHKMTAFYQLTLKLNYRFPLDTIFNDKNKKVVTQNDFDTFIAFIKSEITADEMDPYKPAQENKTKKSKKHDNKETEKKEHEKTTMK